MSAEEKEHVILLIVLVIAFLFFYSGILYVASFEKTEAVPNIEEQELDNDTKELKG